MPYGERASITSSSDGGVGVLTENIVNSIVELGWSASGWEERKRSCRGVCGVEIEAAPAPAAFAEPCVSREGRKLAAICVDPG